MGMDSVEIVQCWEQSLDVAVPDESVIKVTTPAGSVELLSTLVNVNGKTGRCLNQVAFNRVRTVLINEFNIPRSQIKINSRLAALFPKKGQRRSWIKFKRALGVNDLTTVTGFPLFGVGNTRITDIVKELVACRAYLLIDPGYGRALSQLREVVRASVLYVVGVKDFSDYDHYIEDIGID